MEEAAAFVNSPVMCKQGIQCLQEELFSNFVVFQSGIKMVIVYIFLSMIYTYTLSNWKNILTVCKTK
jgi:hypothetical protein